MPSALAVVKRQTEENSQTIRQQTIAAVRDALAPARDETLPEYCVEHDAFRIIILLFPTG